jgi:hypothetical protein
MTNSIRAFFGWLCGDMIGEGCVRKRASSFVTEERVPFFYRWRWQISPLVLVGVTNIWEDATTGGGHKWLGNKTY